MPYNSAQQQHCWYSLGSIFITTYQVFIGDQLHLWATHRWRQLAQENHQLVIFRNSIGMTYIFEIYHLFFYAQVFFKHLFSEILIRKPLESSVPNTGKKYMAKRLHGFSSLLKSYRFKNTYSTNLRSTHIVSDEQKKWNEPMLPTPQNCFPFSGLLPTSLEKWPSGRKNHLEICLAQWGNNFQHSLLSARKMSTKLVQC